MIAVVDYGMGNVGSVRNMLRHLGFDAEISDQHAVLRSASHLILPGVGAFDSGVRHLEERGLRELLHERVVVHGVPTLGICLGMQLMGRTSEEGTLPGLGWLAADTVKLVPVDRAFRVPHMGWTGLSEQRDGHPLLASVEPEARFYFVHSYHLRCDEPASVVARADHPGRFVAVAAEDNVVAVQFHPEKSHAFGMQLLTSFVDGWS